MKSLLLGAFIGLLLTTGWVQADPKAVEAALKLALPTLKADSVAESPIKGVYEVVVGTRLFYVSEDGHYLMQGAMIDLKTREDVTEKKLSGARLSALAKIGTDNMIIFKPKIQKHVVYVFTDIDCGYCRKLHSEMEDYLREGIEIRYLFFPRAGKDTDSYYKAVTVWCSKDRNAALTRAKNGENLARKECKNPVDDHMALASAMGANGTPMIVTEKGTIYPGYVPAKELLKILEEKSEGLPGIDPAAAP
ncbi:MAG: DsbC family protein [Gammaproteobacteria bacterium]|nr:DsbC family protein [Gammaproteobacteria bacterium]NBT44478.1 DsbC family protein [Gammaproteobacteria bacterium]NBY22283.1 DsbC family protein [Gammaproteobacteria bacterium]NDE33504.1 DsbC family protein [Gammaproteobacteria bacterium]NDE55262.1 DsbC family protein [Gammaproteobacteria bacterium]